MEQPTREPRDKTKITIQCKDGSSRIINVWGRWNEFMATDLGRDLEGGNFYSVTVAPK